MSSFSDGILYLFPHTPCSSLAYIYRYPSLLGNDYLATVPVLLYPYYNATIRGLSIIDSFGIVTIQRGFGSVLEDAKGDCVALDSRGPNEVEGR